jgi:hypothetical protein
MANLDEIIQILSDHTIEIVDENGTTNEVIDWTDYRSVADKILALGKPKPLAKNKRCDDNFFCYWNKQNEFDNTKCSMQCLQCKNDEGKL